MFFVGIYEVECLEVPREMLVHHTRPILVGVPVLVEGAVAHPRGHAA